MDAAGLERIRCTVLAGGIIAIHSGVQGAVSEPGAHSRSARRRCTAVLDREPQRLAADPAGGGREAAARAGRGHGASLAARRRLRPCAAGGKRLRPLLVLLCGGAGGGRGGGPGGDRGRARPHGDPGPRRRPRRGAAAARAPDRRRDLGPRPGDGDRRPALLARLRAARRGGRRRSGRRCSATPRSPSPRASSPSAATPTTPRSTRERYLERCRLKTGAAVRVRLPDGLGGESGPAGGRTARDGASCAAFGSRDRPRLPAARRRARRHRPAGADRQGARNRPARRHRDPAADLRDPSATPRCADVDLRDLDAGRGGARSATGSQPRGRSARCGIGRWRWSPTRSAASRGRRSTPSSAQLLELVADGIVDRYG